MVNTNDFSRVILLRTPGAAPGKRECALPLATAGRGHAGGCCHRGGTDNGRHDLGPLPLPGASGDLPRDLRSRCNCMPPRIGAAISPEADANPHEELANQ